MVASEAVLHINEKGEVDGKKPLPSDSSSDDGDDPWALVEPKDTGKPWLEMNGGERLKFLMLIFLKVVLLLGLLYLFICSLDFLSSAFKLLGGKAAGEAFSSSQVLNNPIGNLMMGVLGTVLLQSSSTTTSLVVAMVGAGILKIRPAIFIVMGANIGTSVTNTIVSLGHSVNKSEFRKAFAGATVHDMFNWLSVLCLLPVEWISGAFWYLTVVDLAGESSTTQCGVLCQLSYQITKGLTPTEKDYDQDFLKVITKPFTKLVVQVNKNVIKEIAKGSNETDKSLLKDCKDNTECVYMFSTVAGKWSDAVVGVIVLLIALVLLCVCLVLIVKLLHALLRGKIAALIKKFINADLPGCLRHLTGYIAILLGAGLTILVQSSSIFTSAITPLVGCGVLHIDRMYPLTLGANIGTTITAILASLASDAESIQRTMQIAMVHLFFNITGVIIWYPAPFMRKIPISMAKFLGNTTHKYRWFAVVYLILMFFLAPAALFALSLAGWVALLCVVVPIIAICITIGVIKCIQKKKPSALPQKMRNWKWLPKGMRSLQPYDRVLTTVFTCGGRCKKCGDHEDDTSSEDISIEKAPVDDLEAQVVSGGANAFVGSGANMGVANAGYDQQGDNHTKL